MDNKQRQSIIRHISQKIFVNKVSRTNFSALSEQQETEVMGDMASDAFKAAKIYVAELEIEIEDQDETDFLA